MVMKLDNEFTVGVPIGQAWGVLTDLELIAPCMPGAQLTGVTDGVYTGKVKIKVGPITAEYAGTAQFAEKDDDAYRAVIDARGRDSRGNGNASARISAQLRPTGTNTLVNVTTDLTIAGRIAQFGSGMIKEVSAKLLGQFVECLEGRLGGDASGPLEPPTAVTAGSGIVGAATSSTPAGDAAAGASSAVPPGAVSEIVAGPGPKTAAAEPATSDVEPPPLDLMSVAGRAVYKRLIPLVVGLVVLGVVIYLIVR
jgi:carbon monoxide dehydrogenase subunit G